MTNLYYLGVVVSVSVRVHDVSAQAKAISVSMFYPPRGFGPKDLPHNLVFRYSHASPPIVNTESSSPFDCDYHEFLILMRQYSPCYCDLVSNVTSPNPLQDVYI